ncbi:MAG: hypothetical protein LZF60_10009 [Nitrospira sp.]|nr:MAG: hypothetical protein LZF60_10009 [Nitrospira sp.]
MGHRFWFVAGASHREPYHRNDAGEQPYPYRYITPCLTHSEPPSLNVTGIADCIMGQDLTALNIKRARLGHVDCLRQRRYSPRRRTFPWKGTQCRCMTVYPKI